MIGDHLQDSGLGQEFLDLTTKARVTRGKIDKLGVIRIKIFYPVKDSARRMKCNFRDTLVHHIPDKRLVRRK